MITRRVHSQRSLQREIKIEMWTLTLFQHTFAASNAALSPTNTHAHSRLQYQQRWLRWGAGWWRPMGSSRPQWSAPLLAVPVWCRQCLRGSAGSSPQAEGLPTPSASWWPGWSPPPDPESHRAGFPPHSGNEDSNNDDSHHFCCFLFLLSLYASYALLWDYAIVFFLFV